MEGSGIQEEDFVDYESAISAIPEGATEVILRGARLSEDVVKDLAAALTSLNDKVEWRFDDARQIVDDDDADVVQFAKDNNEDAQDVRCAYVRTALPNITSVKISVTDEVRLASFGLTADPTDEDDFANGFGLKLDKGNLKRASNDILLQKPKYEAQLTEICMRINSEGEVEVLKNNKVVESLGHTSHRRMHAQIGLYESTQRVQLLGTATLPCVASLDLNGCDVGDKGLKLLAPALYLNPVADLNLGLNGIGDEGAKSLAEVLRGDHCKVAVLNLSHNDIKDSGALDLAKAFASAGCPVADVDLTDNGVGDEGAKALARAIQMDTCCVAKLRLALNSIGYEGALHISEALESDACSVDTIDLGYNKPGPGKAGNKRLARAFASTMRLDVA
jgi:hypothetical protein